MKIRFVKEVMMMALLLSNSTLFAQDVQTSTTTAPEVERSDSKKPWSIAADLSTYSNTFASESVEAERGTSLDLTASVVVSPLLKLSLNAVVDKSFVGQQDTTMSDTGISLSIKGYEFNKNLASVHSVAGVVPTSETSREVARLKGAMSVTNGLSYAENWATLTYRLTVRRNFHEFNINADGAKNAEYSFANRLTAAVPLYKKLSMDLDFIFRDLITYDQNQRQNFAFSTGLNYELKNNLNVYISTSNEGSAVKANGRDSNISVFDDKSSTYGAGVNYVF